MKFKTPLAYTIALINTGFILSALAADSTGNKVASSPAYKASNPWELEEIIVTATKRETNLMQTPIAITVVKQETLDREGVTNAKDIAKLIPNMDIAFDSSQSAPIISMRGVRSTNTTELGDPAVGLHLDGIYSPRPQGAMALLFDVERIEAQRGPQGTLFGRNSTVGNINIINKRPKMETLEGSAGVELGRWNERQVRGMINIPIADTFALRATFIKETRDSYLNGYYDPNQWDTRYLSDKVKTAPAYTGNPNDRNLIQQQRWWGAAQEVVKADPATFYNNADQYAFRIAGLWEPIDELTWMLAYEKFQDSSAGTINTVNCELAAKRVKKNGSGQYLDANGNVSTTPVPGLMGCEYIYGKGADSYTVNVNTPGMLDLSIQNIRSNLHWDFADDMAFVYNAGLAKQVRSALNDQDRGVTNYDMSIFFNDATFTSQSHELQIQSTGNSKLQWITGIFLFRESNDMEGGFLGAEANADYWQQPDRNLASAAAFAQGTYRITDDLGLTLGYRHTADTKEDVGGHNKFCNDGKPNQVNPTANGGKCLPTWDNTAFNKLPKDYFLNRNIYSIGTNNDIKGSWNYDNYRLGLDYNLDESKMVYGYIANGTKAGGIGDVLVQELQNPNDASYLLNPDGSRQTKRWENKYDKEEVVTLETGLKADFFNKTLRLNTSLFYSDYSDMQVASPRGLFVDYHPGNPVTTSVRTVFQTVNIGKAKIEGLEFEYDWAPTSNDRLNGFITFLKTEITSNFMQQWGYSTVDLYEISYPQSVDPANTQLAVNLKGNELPASPKAALSVNYNHSFHLPNDSTIMPWVSYTWRASSYYSIFNVDKHKSLFKSETPDAYSDKRPATSNLNVGVQYAWAHDVWNVEVFCNNVTDETDFISASGSDGVVSGPVTMPRFFGVRANYNFF